MRIFKHRELCPYGSIKVNFVDDKNVFVGYELRNQCCESAGFSITHKQPDFLLEFPPCSSEEINAEGYDFDTAYLVEWDNGSFSGGGFHGENVYFAAVTFRLTKGSDEVFLTLHNMQNGYYSHGFTAEICGKQWKQGEI